MPAARHSFPLSQFTESHSRFVHAASVWSGHEGWNLLLYYNVYRFGLAVLLVAFALPGYSLSIRLPEQALPVIASAFVSVSAGAFLTIRKRWPAIHFQAHALFFLDLVFISILGVSQELHTSTVVVFYVIAVGAAAVMFRTAIALGYASIATAMIYAVEIYEIIRGRGSAESLYLSAVTALGLFSIVLVVSLMARKTRVVQDVLRQQELEIADLDYISQNIVDQLNIGVLFIDDDFSIKLINHRAREAIKDYISGDRLIGKLAEQVAGHSPQTADRRLLFRYHDRVLGIYPTQARNGVLLRIEDQTGITREMQRSKLNSMSRMASAIAHEIRNPLNAINHAAQLIQPTGNSGETQQMVGLIRKHVSRIDEIIESVLDKSKPGQVEQATIALRPWLKNFIQTFKLGASPVDTQINLQGANIVVCFDPTQLEQVLTNLCQNSLQYGRDEKGHANITLETGRDEDSTPYLNIMDTGKPIAEHEIERLFEPFFTTDSRGTGLGLYLSQEFCSLNGADLRYVRERRRKGFRISFLNSAK